MNNYQRQKLNTIKWIRRSNPEAWFRINMGPQKYNEYLNEQAKKRKELAEKKSQQIDEK